LQWVSDYTLFQFYRQFNFISGTEIYLEWKLYIWDHYMSDIYDSISCVTLNKSYDKFKRLLLAMD
jgi:hypothetical protein